MELTEERKKFLQETYGDNWEEVLQSGDLQGQDLTKLLMGDLFVRAYQTETNKLLNNFLGHLPVWRGKNGYNADAPNSQSEVDVKVYNMTKTHELTMIERNILYVNHSGKYSPITPLMMKHIIELDEMMRLSKSWAKSTHIYRGCDESEFEDGVLDGLNSTTNRMKTGISFCSNNRNGVVLDIEIPENFPAFSLYQVNRQTTLKKEQEVVLPPCD